MSLRGLGSAALNVLLPPRCAACDEIFAVPTPYGLCANCIALLELNGGPRCRSCDAPGLETCARCQAEPPSFHAVVTPYLYAGVMTGLVGALKFEKREDVGELLGRLLADAPRVQTAMAGIDSLVPVPLSRRRRRNRGYNQSTILARVLGARLGIPVSHLLHRQRHTQAQSDLPLAERLHNVRDAFIARPTRGRVALVDDVVTSTETARAATQALRAAGAQEVVVIALARTPLE